MLYVAGFSFEDLGLCVLHSRAKTRKRGRRSTCHGSQSGWKDLSLSPQSSRQHCAVMLQKFTDFKSLDIVPSITGHWCHRPIWVSVNTFNICSQSQGSQNIFRAHLWRPPFFHRTVSSSANASAFVCARHTRACTCLCVHMWWLTLLSPCQIKAWKMVRG